MFSSQFGKGDRFNDDYKTWKADVSLVGTTPEKKIETRITHDVNNMQTDVTVDMHNMLPWLRKVCITSHVISGAEARFHLKFGEDCQQYRIQVSVQSMYRDYYYRETSEDWMDGTC